MVLEYVTGGELFDKIVSFVCLSYDIYCFRHPLKAVSLIDYYLHRVLLYVKTQALKGRLGEADARKLFQQLIDAVSYCHEKGVYHRDLKVFIFCAYYNRAINFIANVEPHSNFVYIIYLLLVCANDLE